MISAKVVLDSKSTAGARITTFLLTYPRYIHAEFMTHREFSRNASSSRAIPFKRLRRDMLESIHIPTYYANQSGMQGGAELPPWKQMAIGLLWKAYAWSGALFGTLANSLGAAKQHVNRFIEQTGHITVVMTSTSFSNFFALRYHKDAQPEICELAKAMYEAYQASEPQSLQDHEWHLPFVSRKEIEAFVSAALEPPWTTIDWLPLIKRSVARCARTSYLTHDKKVPNVADDQKLYDRLVGSTPKHASPTEHQARPFTQGWGRSGNLVGFEQFRKFLIDEYIKEFKL